MGGHTGLPAGGRSYMRQSRLPRLVRETLKRSIGAQLEWVVRTGIRWSGRRVGVALVYHCVGERPAGADRKIVHTLDQSAFRAQLAHLGRHYRVVRACRLPEEVARRRPGQRIPAALTFDDDIRSHVSVAVPALTEAGMTATFFLTGASLETPYEFWWERLERTWHSGADLSSVMLAAGVGIARDATLRQIAQAVEGLPVHSRRRFAATLAEVAGPGPLDAGLRAAHVRELLHAGFEIGFHTREHQPLSHLTDAELAEAVTVGRRELERAGPGPLRMLAYPHGDHDSRVERAADRAGYRLAFTTHRAPITPDSRRFALGRLVAPTDAGGPFALALARTLVTRGDTGPRASRIRPERGLRRVRPRRRSDRAPGHPPA
jgi:peptidoglycan/xylan/chitin deacetylase (PgdA/CDA1 family)